ncbi:hypothetical protein BDW68DRAFT_116097 [Aspergillus falconensis]
MKSYFIFHCPISYAFRPPEEQRVQCRNPEPNSEIAKLEDKSSALGLLRTPTRSACSASERAASWSCTECTRDAGRPSWWSSPSCGRRAWSDHRNRSASGRNGAYPGQIGRPGQSHPYQYPFSACRWDAVVFTFPALYWVTLCWVCLWHSLPLQYVLRVLGTLTYCTKNSSASVQVNHLMEYSAVGVYAPPCCHVPGF